MLTGLSAFPITPSDAEGRIDLAGLRTLLAPLVSARVDSIGLLGSTGTYPFFSRAERRRALEAAVAQAEGRTPILVGVGALRTDEAVQLTRDAKAIGATAGLLAPVSYTPLLDDEVFEHFATVAKEGLPLCIYDNPGTTHFSFGPALIGRLARVDNVVAVKSPAPAKDAAAHLATLRGAVGADTPFSIGCSVDIHIAEALIAGAEAWYSVVGGTFPGVCLRIVEAVRTGDADRARRLHADLEPLWALFREFTSLRVVYALAEICGLCRATPPRPILPLPEPARRKVAATYERLRPVLGE